MRHVLGDVQRQRRLAHAGPRGQDDQLRLVQAAGQACRDRESRSRCRRWRARASCGRRSATMASCRMSRMFASSPAPRSSRIAKIFCSAWAEHLAGVDATRRRRRAGSRCWSGSATAAWPCRGRSRHSTWRWPPWAPIAEPRPDRPRRRRPRSRRPLFSRSTSSVVSIRRPVVVHRPHVRVEHAVGVVVEIFGPDDQRHVVADDRAAAGCCPARRARPRGCSGGCRSRISELTFTPAILPGGGASTVAVADLRRRCSTVPVHVTAVYFFSGASSVTVGTTQTFSSPSISWPR